MSTSTELVVAPCRDGSGNWYWALRLANDGVYADGEADDREQAIMRATAAYDEWRAKQVPETDGDGDDGKTPQQVADEDFARHNPHDGNME